MIFSGEVKSTKAIVKSTFPDHGHGDFKVKDALKWAYGILQREYRNEFVYKNELALQLIKLNHKDPVVGFNEFSIGASQLDLMVVNGTTTAYEIKTELDNFNRLSKQLWDYSLVCDRSYVVTYLHLVDQLLKIVSPHVGVIGFDGKKFLKIRPASKCIENLSTKHLLGMLRKPEYLGLFKEEFGFVPNVPNTQLFDYICHSLNELGAENLHKRVVSALLERRKKERVRIDLRCVPKPIKGYALYGKLQNATNLKLQNALNEYI